MEIEFVALAQFFVGKTIRDPAFAICLVMKGSGRGVSKGCAVFNGRALDFLLSTLVCQFPLGH